MYHIMTWPLSPTLKLNSKTKAIFLRALVHKHRCLNIRCYINEIVLNKTKAVYFNCIKKKKSEIKWKLWKILLNFIDTISNWNQRNKLNESCFFKIPVWELPESFCLFVCFSWKPEIQRQITVLHSNEFTLLFNINIGPTYC